MLTGFRRMSIQDVQVLIAQARLEADDPAFKVRGLVPAAGKEAEFIEGLFPPLCLHW